MGDLDKDRLLKVQSLEAKLEGMDEGAERVAVHLQRSVAQLWEHRVVAQDASMAAMVRLLLVRRDRVIIALPHTDN